MLVFNKHQIWLQKALVVRAVHGYYGNVSVRSGLVPKISRSNLLAICAIVDESGTLRTIFISSRRSRMSTPSIADRSPGRGSAPFLFFFSSDAARLFPVSPSPSWPSAGKTASSGVKVRPASLLDLQIRTIVFSQFVVQNFLLTLTHNV